MRLSTIYAVRGMTCDHCVRAVTQELTKVDSVEDVEVDLAAGVVTVISSQPIDDGEVRAAVDEAGFEVVP